MANVTLKNICKSFGTVEISKNVNLEIQDGEFVVFVGPSGCGKSTLLRMIAGLEDITSGELFIGKEKVNDKPPMEREVGMVFQSYALYPHMNVEENMGFGLKLAGRPKAEIKKRVDEVARVLQLEKLLERKPKDLSGGQRQRVAIGRTLVREPKVFLFDEPLSNLDAALRVQMRIEISRLHQRLKSTMIYVTHDQVEAMTLADKIVALDLGFIAQVGKPLDLYHYPANKFVAGFIGSPKMNFMGCTVRAADATGVTASLPGGMEMRLPVDGSGLQPGEAVTLGIRPEHFVAAEEGEFVLVGQVTVVERLGYQTLVHAEVEGFEETITIRVDGAGKARENETIRMGIQPTACHLFRADGTACPRLHREADIDF